MFGYMLDKEEMGSYIGAYKHAQAAFSRKDPLEMAKLSGTVFDSEKSSFTVTSLGQILEVKYPEGTIRFGGTALSPRWNWRLIVLNYLARADATPLTGELITYKELEGGAVFFPAFYKMNNVRLMEALSGKSLPEIKKACLALKALLKEEADLSAVFLFLPRFPIMLKLWLPDEEMAGSANILFDASANHYLHTEDIAVAVSLIVDFLIDSMQEGRKGQDLSL